MIYSKSQQAQSVQLNDPRHFLWSFQDDHKSFFISYKMRNMCAYIHISNPKINIFEGKVCYLLSTQSVWAVRGVWLTKRSQ